MDRSCQDPMSTRRGWGRGIILKTKVWLDCEGSSSEGTKEMKEAYGYSYFTQLYTCNGSYPWPCIICYLHIDSNIMVNDANIIWLVNTLIMKCKKRGTIRVTRCSSFLGRTDRKSNEKRTLDPDRVCLLISYIYITYLLTYIPSYEPQFEFVRLRLQRYLILVLGPTVTIV